jgi:branched-chain amino acid transport system ATP-binding protein
MLAVEGLCAGYGRAQVLREVSFTLGAGRVMALLGRNGAGKSTTIKAVMGLLRPSSGAVLFEGRELAGLAPYQIARAGLGYVPEERRIFRELTVRENLAVGRQRAPEGMTPWTEARLFALFPNLGTLRDRLGGAMSGGEQQMLAVARCLMGNPRLVLLDEPGEGLAPKLAATLAEAVRQLPGEGVSVLLAEQNPHFAQHVGDEAVVLEGGAVVWAGGMAAFRADHAAQARYLAVSG